MLLAAVVLAMGCSGSAGPAALQPARDLITGEELRKADFVNVLDAIEKLRPLWLANRGPDSFTDPSQVVVYSDNVKLGDVSSLRNVSMQSIRYIRRYDGRAAQVRWGSGHAAGVILVSSQDR
jgi:hypothetical protein